jgi:hypothetical protein
MEYDVFARDTMVGHAVLEWTVPAALPPHCATPSLVVPPLRFWSGPFRPAPAYAAIEIACQLELGGSMEQRWAHQARQEALALSLRTTAGDPVPTHFVLIQDASAQIRAIHPPDAERPEVRQVIACPAEVDKAGHIVPLAETLAKARAAGSQDAT